MLSHKLKWQRQEVCHHSWTEPTSKNWTLYAESLKCKDEITIVYQIGQLLHRCSLYFHHLVLLQNCWHYMMNYIILALVKLRLNLPYQDLAHRWRVSISIVIRIFHKWINVMGIRMKFLLKWLNRDILQHNLPQVFRETYRNTVCALRYSLKDQPVLKLEEKHTFSTKNTTLLNFWLGLLLVVQYHMYHDAGESLRLLSDTAVWILRQLQSGDSVIADRLRKTCDSIG
jgi:hypothetical protein